MRTGGIFMAALFLLLTLASPVAATPQEAPASPPTLLPLKVQLPADSPDGEPRDMTTAIEIVLLLTFLTLLPPLLLSMTCFTRIVIVLSFVRRAMATPELPPNPVLIGLALFLTAAVMQPVAARMHDQALQPYLEGELSFPQALDLASGEMKQFMARHTDEEHIALFLDVFEEAPIDGPEDLPMRVSVPAFILSELSTAFRMGFVLFLPFLVIDLVVASILLSMGMFMLPPMIIATPVKILLFVLVDGWELVVQQLWTGLVAAGAA